MIILLALLFIGGIFVGFGYRGILEEGYARERAILEEEAKYGDMNIS